MEREQQSQIPFLDTMVIRSPNSKLLTNWYVKPTASGRVVNYLSSHATTQKISIIKNLLYRSYKLSSPQFYKENTQKIKQILKNNNNYPNTLINRVLNKYERKLTLNSVHVPEMTYFKFPFVPGLSTKIQKHIDHVNPNCRLALYNPNTLNSIFSRLKYPTPKDISSNLVYKIPCGGAAS